MNTILKESLESIDFQLKSNLINDIALQIASARKDPSKAMFSRVSKSIAKIVKDSTGISIRLTWAKLQDFNAFVLVPSANIANPMRPDEVMHRVRRTPGQAITEKAVFQGTVDLTKGKVSGIYSDIPCDIFMAVEWLTDPRGAGITDRQLATVLVHEVGHLMYYFRYLGKVTISSLVVAEIVKRQQEGESSKVIQEVLQVQERNTGIRYKDYGDIDASTETMKIQQLVFEAVRNEIRSELGTNFYDKRAFEFAADQFVARHGGASDLVQALDSIYKIYGIHISEYRGSAVNLIYSTVSYISLLVRSFSMGYGLAVITSASGFAIPMMFAGLCVFVGSFFGAMDEGIYDPIPHRFKAMRRELIAQAKLPDLDVQMRTNIIEQIKIIDDVLDKHSSLAYFGADVLASWMHGILTGRTGEQKFHRQLENLVNNRMFELSNQLLTKKV